MKGWGKYKKLTRSWEEYIFSQLYPDFIKEFPTTKGMTQKKVGQWLVKHNWIDELQKYTYRAYTASGATDMTFREFKTHLLHYKTYNGKTINAWKNSLVQSVSKRMVRRMKKGSRHFNERLTKLKSTDSIAYLRQLEKTMVSPPKGFSRRLRKLETAGYTEAQYSAELASIKKIIEDDIVNKQYPMYTKDTFDKVNNFQGKRISEDQLQKGYNNQTEELIKQTENLEEEDLIVEGVWHTSPSHKSHTYKGGEDPCDVYDKQKYFYGRDIPVPVGDTHMGCKCYLETRVIPKSKMKH